MARLWFTHPALVSWFCFLVVFATSERVQAQVNTDTLRPGPMRPGLSGGLDASFMMLGGNVELIDAGLGARLTARTFYPTRDIDGDVPPYIRQQSFLTGNIKYTARAGNAFVNQGLLHGRWTAMWHRRFGSNLFVQHQFNEFQRLRVRSVWGASAAVGIVHGKRLNVLFGSGYMYEYNRITPSPNTTEVLETFEHRWSNFLGMTLTAFDGRLAGQSTTYFQPRFDKMSDLRFLEEIEMLVKVNDNLGFGGSFSALYDSAPPAGVVPMDTRVMSNVRLSF